MCNQSDWPDFFPEGVPPDNATPANGEAFRLVNNVPPFDSDFRSSHEEYPGRQFRPDSIGIRFGVSFYRDLSRIMQTRRRYKPLRDRRIVIGTLRSSHGVCLKTCGPSHLTVWRRSQSEIHPDFIIDAEAT